jgi:hypothetical protein
MQGISPIQPLIAKIRLENICEFMDLQMNSLRDGAANYFAHSGNFLAGAGNWAGNRSARPDASNCVEGSPGRIRQ